MTHQHGGRPGSGTYGGGRGARGGGSSDVGSRNWEIAHGIDVGGKASGFAPGSGNRTGGGGEDGGSYGTGTVAEPKAKEQTEEKGMVKTFPELWRFFVNDYEWDLSDVVDINRPCRDYCYWILIHKNGKKTRISGNVILEEI